MKARAKNQSQRPEFITAFDAITRLARAPSCRGFPRDSSLMAWILSTSPLGYQTSHEAGCRHARENTRKEACLNNNRTRMCARRTCQTHRLDTERAPALHCPLLAMRVGGNLSSAETSSGLAPQSKVWLSPKAEPQEGSKSYARPQ